MERGPRLQWVRDRIDRSDGIEDDLRALISTAHGGREAINRQYLFGEPGRREDPEGIESLTVLFSAVAGPSRPTEEPRCVCVRVHRELRPVTGR